MIVGRWARTGATLLGVAVLVAALVSLAGATGAGAAAGAGTVALRLSVTGPAYSGDAPDPSVLEVGGTYYAYTTENGVDNIPLLESTDLVHWQAIGDVLPVLPPWAQTGNTWSPSVVTAPGGGYEMFYDAYDPALGIQCIGRATSSSPAGPFVDASTAPFVCQQNLGGSIDASVYHRRGGDVLVWKSDGTPGIWSQQLGPGDAGLVGTPVQLLAPGASWEDGIIEGPTLVRIGSTLTLWFSAGRWSGAGYSVGMAVCSSPLSPCDAGSVTQELSTGAGLVGPGGPSFFDAKGRLVMAFAAWVGNVRGLYLADVST